MRVNHYLYRGGIMDNAMKMIGDIVSSLTKILVAVIGLGVVAGIVFGDTWFFGDVLSNLCLLYTSPSPRDGNVSRMPSSA